MAGIQLSLTPSQGCLRAVHAAAGSLPAPSFHGHPLLRGKGKGHSLGRRAFHPLPGKGPRHSHPLVTAAVSTTTTGAGSDIMSSLVGFLRRLIPTGPGSAPEDQQGGEEPPKVGRRVAVVGATGKSGRHAVKQLLEKGHSVTVLASSLTRAREVLGGMGLQVEALAPEEVEQEGRGTEGRDNRRGARAGVVAVVEGDVQDAAAVQALLRGADSVLCCLGSRFGPEGYLPGCGPQEVDWKGVSALVRAAAVEFSENASESRLLLEGHTSTIFDFTSCTEASGNGEGLGPEEQRLPGWMRVDDVIMGGQSESVMRPGDGYAVFEGMVRVDGGGFCGCRALFPSPIDASEYDGFRIRVRGDGRRYKINTKDASMPQGELQYQASFDTVRGKWVDVFIPFNRFRSVAKASQVPDAAPLDLSNLVTLNFIASRFQYNGFPNPLFEPGPFRLEISSVALERKPRSQFILLSSAVVERSSRAETPQEREQSIPIVKLNPSGILSWKLSGEDVLRASGLRYTIVRPCGLTDEDEDQPFLLESSQGDAITGLISRPEAAAVLVQALESPYASDVTFEVRRDDLSQGLPMTPRHWDSLFARLRPDVPGALVQYPHVPAEQAKDAE